MAAITIGDITAVISYPQFREDPGLADAIFEHGTMGQPKFFSGGLAVVFPVQVKGKKLAYRCWYTQLGNLNDRYRIIYDHLATQQRPYIIDSSYNPRGLRVNNALWPTMIMDWVEGKVLIDWIADNSTNPVRLKAMAQKLLDLFQWLHQAQISHGDLQTDNIIVRPDESVVLIDYDTICVPGLVGQKDLLAGKKGFQHPSRIQGKNKATLKADYFSELIIYSGLIALSENPKLFTDFKVGPGNDFFIIQDKNFTAIDQSAAFIAIQNTSTGCKLLMQLLAEYLQAATIEDLEPFHIRYDSLSKPPEIIQLNINKNTVLSGQEVMVSWQVQNAESLELNYGAGQVTHLSCKSICADRSGYITLTASNGFGTVFKSEWIEVKPQPVILQFEPEKRQIKQGETTGLIWRTENAQEVIIKNAHGTNSYSASGRLDIGPQQHEVFELTVTGLDGTTKIQCSTDVQVFKPVTIEQFELDRYITLDTVPARLSWQVPEAVAVTIRTIRDTWQVANTGSMEVRPRETTRYMLEASNPLFTVNGSCELIVDEFPRIQLTVPPLTKDSAPLIPAIDMGALQLKELPDVGGMSDWIFEDGLPWSLAEKNLNLKR